MSSAVRYQVMPPLSSEEYQELYESIKAEGVLEPIHVDEEGVVIDGHHRSRIASELGVPCPVITHDDLDDAGKRSLAFTLNLKRRHLNREQRRALGAESVRLDPIRSNREHAQRTGLNHKTIQSIREAEGIPSPREIIADAVRESPEKSSREIARELGVDHKTVGAVRGGENGEITQIPQPEDSLTRYERNALNSPELDRVDPELEARVKAMSSAPNSGQYINSDSAASRNEKRYRAMSTAREILAQQKDLIALLGEVGGFKGIDGLLDSMDEYTEMAREMSRNQDIDNQLNNLMGGN